MARLATIVLACVGAACSVGALDGFSGGASGTDGGPGDAAPEDDGGSGTDTSPTVVKGPSCRAIKAANPQSPNGR